MKGKLGDPKLSTCKPSGTISTMTGVSPGCHPFVSDSKHYWRRMRIDALSYLVDKATDDGIHCEQRLEYSGKEDPNTKVLRFPEKVPDGAPTADEVPAEFFLDKVTKRLLVDWADNSVSASCHFAETELLPVRAWLDKYYNTSVKSISCFPKMAKVHGFKQLPYEGITEAVYLEEMSRIHLDTNIDPKYFKKAGNDEDSHLAQGECTSGFCPLR